MDANFLTHKLGPFPLWAWVGVGVAGLLIFKKTKTTGTANVGTAGLAGTSAANLPNGTAFNPQDFTLVQEGYNPPSITVNAPSTDTRAPYVSYVRDPVDTTVYGVDANGNRSSLTWNQYVALGRPKTTDLAPALKGSKGAATVIPRASTLNHPANIRSKQVTINSGSGWDSSLQGIAQHYYNDASQVTRIAQANGIANPNIVTPGMQILVP